MKPNQTEPVGPSMFSVRGWTLNVALALLLFSSVSALADVHYVDVNSTNATPPYTNWATAATNIQDAVDAAVAGDAIVVTNGIYATGRRNGSPGSGDKALIIRGVNGPQFTSIDGGFWVRCIYLINGASLSCFTLANGYVEAGFGGTAYGGGAYGGTLNNCTLTGNSVFSVYAGAYVSGGG